MTVLPEQNTKEGCSPVRDTTPNTPHLESQRSSGGSPGVLDGFSHTLKEPRSGRIEPLTGQTQHCSRSGWWWNPTPALCWREGGQYEQLVLSACRIELTFLFYSGQETV